MPKPTLAEPQRTLESTLIESMIAGLHEWRPDLYGPESMSDYQACARGILQMFDVKRSPLPNKLTYWHPAGWIGEGDEDETEKQTGSHIS